MRKILLVNLQEIIKNTPSKYSWICSLYRNKEIKEFWCKKSDCPECPFNTIKQKDVINNKSELNKLITNRIEHVSIDDQ